MRCRKHSLMHTAPRHGDKYKLSQMILQQLDEAAADGTTRRVG